MRSYKIYISLILFTFFCPHLYCQTDTIKNKETINEDKAHFILSGGLSYQKQFVGELGVIYGYSGLGDMCNPSGLIGLKLASEFNFTSNNFFIAPKIGGQIDFYILGARLNIIDYTNFNYHDFKFTPEIGLSLTGFVDLFYGYNFSLTEKRIHDIGTHRVTLTINFDPKLWIHRKK
jgi:hypothetical protein